MENNNVQERDAIVAKCDELRRRVESIIENDIGRMKSECTYINTDAGRIALSIHAISSLIDSVLHSVDNLTTQYRELLEDISSIQTRINHLQLQPTARYSGLGVIGPGSIGRGQTPAVPVEDSENTGVIETDNSARYMHIQTPNGIRIVEISSARPVAVAMGEGHPNDNPSQSPSVPAGAVMVEEHAIPVDMTDDEETVQPVDGIRISSVFVNNTLASGQVCAGIVDDRYVDSDDEDPEDVDSMDEYSAYEDPDDVDLTQEDHEDEEPVQGYVVTGGDGRRYAICRACNSAKPMSDVRWDRYKCEVCGATVELD